MPGPSFGLLLLRSWRSVYRFLFWRKGRGYTVWGGGEPISAAISVQSEAGSNLSNALVVVELETKFYDALADASCMTSNCTFCLWVLR